MTKATISHARDWLLAVRVPLGITESPAEASIQCTLAARSIAQDYSREDLCVASREAVSKTLRWFREPDIRQALDKWRAENAPAAATMPDEARNAPLHESGKRLYARFLTAADDTQETKALSWMRDFDRETFDWIVRHDAAAAGYAVRHRWEPTPTREEIRASFDDELAIAATIRRILQPMPDGSLWTQAKSTLDSYRVIVTLFAPQHLHLFADTTMAAEDAVPVAFPDDATPLWEIG